jgi:hypothetical protein
MSDINNNGGRPRKKYTYRKNGDSLQFYIDGFYIGSKSIEWLCENVKAEKFGKGVYAR